MEIWRQTTGYLKNPVKRNIDQKPVVPKGFLFDSFPFWLLVQDDQIACLGPSEALAQCEKTLQG